MSSLEKPLIGAVNRDSVEFGAEFGVKQAEVAFGTNIQSTAEMNSKGFTNAGGKLLIVLIVLYAHAEMFFPISVQVFGRAKPRSFSLKQRLKLCPVFVCLCHSIARFGDTDLYELGYLVACVWK